MILHIVLFRFNPDISWSSQVATSAEKTSLSHKQNIPHIKAWFCGRNFSLRPQAADFFIMGLFENSNKLEQYMVHENHVLGIEKWKKISTWEIADIDLTKGFPDSDWWNAFSGSNCQQSRAPT